MQLFPVRVRLVSWIVAREDQVKEPNAKRTLRMIPNSIFYPAVMTALDTINIANHTLLFLSISNCATVRNAALLAITPNDEFCGLRFVGAPRN